MEQVLAVLGRGVVNADDAVVTADDLGMVRGDGCFDATRVVTSSAGEHTVDHLGAHLDRFEASIDGMDLPTLDRMAWSALIEEALAAWRRPGEATLKLLITRGRESGGPPTGLVTITAFDGAGERAGIRVAALTRGYSSTLFDEVPWLLGGVKTTSYAVNMAAKREAKRRGAHDALFTTSDGFALEGPNAALVWAKDGTLLTTPLEHTGVLRSITQRAAFDGARAVGVPTVFQLGRLEEIVAADGAWLLSSIRGVAPIVALDDQPLSPDPGWTAALNRWTGFPETSD